MTGGGSIATFDRLVGDVGAMGAVLPVLGESEEGGGDEDDIGAGDLDVSELGGAADDVTGTLCVSSWGNVLAMTEVSDVDAECANKESSMSSAMDDTTGGEADTAGGRSL